MASNTITTTRSVTVSGPPEQARSLVEQAMVARKGKIIDGDGDLSAKFGSQTMLRLIGGWIMPTTSFPVKAHADFEPADSGTVVHIRVADSMGVGTKKGIAGKYERAVEQVADHLASALAR